jgi:hypothetical protein
LLQLSESIDGEAVVSIRRRRSGTSGNWMDWFTEGYGTGYAD